MSKILKNEVADQLSELDKVLRENSKKIIALQAYKETCTDQKITIELFEAGIQAMMEKYRHTQFINRIELLDNLQTVLNLNTLKFTPTDPRISSNPQY